MGAPAPDLTRDEVQRRFNALIRNRPSFDAAKGPRAVSKQADRRAAMLQALIREGRTIKAAAGDLGVSYSKAKLLAKRGV